VRQSVVVSVSLSCARCYKLALYEPAHLIDTTAERGNCLTNTLMSMRRPGARLLHSFRHCSGDCELCIWPAMQERRTMIEDIRLPRKKEKNCTNITAGYNMFTRHTGHTFIGSLLPRQLLEWIASSVASAALAL